MKQSLIKSALQTDPACPTLEALERDLQLAPGNVSRVAAERHLEACANCRTELAFLQQFQSGNVSGAEQKDVAWIEARLKNPAATAEEPRVIEIQPARWRRFWSPAAYAAVAAAAVLVVVLAIDVRRPVEVPQNPNDVLRSTSLHAVMPVGDLPAAPQEFRWTSVPGAVSYDLTVTEVDRTPVWQGKTTAVSSSIPLEVSRILRPGKTLLWNVKALDSSGHELVSSGEQRFRVQAPHD